MPLRQCWASSLLLEKKGLTWQRPEHKVCHSSCKQVRTIGCLGPVIHFLVCSCSDIRTVSICNLSLTPLLMARELPIFCWQILGHEDSRG